MTNPPNPNDTYTSPLASRNASEEMLRLWSPRHKFNTWRRVWLAVAEAQHEVTKGWGCGGDSERARSASEGQEGQKSGESLARASGSSRTGPLVTREQVEELRAVVERGITDEEMARAAEIESELRHDVMAHVHCLGESCPKAKAIIHLGCTSQDVVCNADIAIIREAWGSTSRKLARTIASLAEAADQHKRLPTLGFTHYQSAQPTTVGRRIAYWAFDLHFVYDKRFSWGGPTLYRGFRGATGTQASFLALFGEDRKVVDRFEGSAVYTLIRADREQMDIPPEEGSHAEYWSRLFDGQEYCDASISMFDKLDANATEIGGMCGFTDLEMGMFRARWLSSSSFEQELWVQHQKAAGNARSFLEKVTTGITGQTYPRVIDTLILADLASIAAVLHKIATDIRLLSNRKEIDEPFGSKQIGSSAMPYKRNPMRCERICGLTRFVMNLVGNAYDTAATQWLERTLDDSSNRRLSLPESFLALDGALDLMHNVASGLVVHEAMVRKNLMLELPFLATENILMEAVKAGGDRQDLHERIRVHAQEAGHRVKHLGLDNNLIGLLKADPAFASVHDRLTDGDLLDPMKYVGRSVEQTERFIAEVIEPLRERYKDELTEMGDSEPRV